MAIGKSNLYTRLSYSGKDVYTGLVFIEPKGPQRQTLDSLTLRTARLMERLIPRGARYKGVHICSCGKRSNNSNLFFKTHVTHSLLLHYVAYHREEIPQEDIEELEKVLRLAGL